MYQKFRMEILSALSDLQKDALQRVAQTLDLLSGKYSVTDTVIAPDPAERERFRELARAYIITRKTEGMAETTMKQTMHTIDLFIDASVKPIESVKTADIRAYLFNYQQARGVSNRSLNFVRSILCSFFRWVSAEGYIPADPATSVKPIKFSAKPRKALSQLELEKVRRACHTERETCIVETLYSTGCRISELCGIKLADINWDKREIQVLGKGGKYRTVYINAKALVSIQSYLQTRRHSSEYLICNDRGGGQLKKSNVEKLFRRIEQESGVTVTPHIMRHTMATQALTGTSVEVVQRMLGHSNISTTMIYAEVDPRSVHAAHDKCII